MYGISLQLSIPDSQPLSTTAQGLLVAILSVVIETFSHVFLDKPLKLQCYVHI